MKLPRCPECGEEVRLSGGVNRTYTLSNCQKVSIPDWFEIPTCTSCGEESYTRKIIDQLEELLSRTNDVKCISFGLAGPYSNHVGCPVIVDGVVCRCECTECKREWWKLDRPTQKEICVICSSFCRPLNGSGRCQRCSALESHIRDYTSSSVGLKFVQELVAERARKPLCEHTWGNMCCSQEKGHSCAHVYSTKTK